MLEQNKCDIRDQHGLEHIFHCVTDRIVDFCIFTPRTMHPTPHTHTSTPPHTAGALLDLAMEPAVEDERTPWTSVCPP